MTEHGINGGKSESRCKCAMVCRGMVPAALGGRCRGLVPAALGGREQTRSCFRTTRFACEIDDILRSLSTCGYCLMSLSGIVTSIPWVLWLLMLLQPAAAPRSRLQFDLHLHQLVQDAAPG